MRQRGGTPTILSLAFTYITPSGLGGGGHLTGRISGVKFSPALPCPGLVLRNENETKHLSDRPRGLLCPIVCLQIACLKSSLPCIFPFFEHFVFVFLGDHMHVIEEPPLFNLH
jgi:hypothetical protein